MTMGSNMRRKLLLMVWAFLFVWLSNGPSWQAAASTDQNDVTALLALYKHWSSQPQNNMPNSWTGNDPCGSTGVIWAGVLCDESLTHVLNLSLISYNLTAGIPPEIGDLASLQYLDLSFNSQLGGPIPTQLDQLTALSHLALMNCGLQGEIPVELGSLVNLDFLALNSNDLNGTIPAQLGNLAQLTWFDISENSLTSPLPIATANSVGLDSLTNCQHFHFYNNSFTGGIPQELFNLPALLHMLLSFNGFSGPIPSTTLANAKSLAILSLDNNQLSGVIPPQLNQITTLQELHLNGNRFTGTLPNLSSLTGLQLLDVGLNSFSPQPVPTWTYSLNAALTISMPSSNLYGVLNSSIFSLPAIQTLDLSTNDLSGSIVFSNPSSTLQTINLQNNNISGLDNTNQLQGSQFNNVSIRVYGNPVCVNSPIFTGTQICQQISNAPFQWAAPPNPSCSVVCGGGSNLNPNYCNCAVPLVCSIQLTEPNFRSVNSTAIASLTKEFADDFKSMGLISDDRQVYIGSAQFSSRGGMLFNLLIFPTPGNSLNGTAVNNIVGLLSLQVFPLTEGPYVVRSTSKPPISSSSKSKTSIGLIIGVVVAVVVVAIILGLVAFYAFRQKMRADKAETSRPFALWGATTKDGGEAPELKGARWFSLAELKKATNNFSEANEIGAGGYGKVYKAELQNGRVVAVKRADQSSVQGAAEFKNEIELLSRVHHRNLVGLVGFCYEQGEQALVYEFVPNGTLREHLLGFFEKPLSWDMRVGIALGSAKGLTYLHESANPPIIHRDIKSGNILLDETMTAKVADFGLSKLAQTNQDKAHISTQVKGTLGYLDPEYYMTNQLTEKSDVYSFGVVMLEMLSARPPIERGRYIVREVRTALNKGGIKALEPLLDPLLGDYPPKQLESFLDVALLCVEEVAAGRPTMNEVVKKLEVIAGHSQPNSGVHITIEPQKDVEVYSKEYLQGIDDRSFQYSGASFASSVPLEPK
ncbi:unnamed protein product [Calypogeia fissa]